MNVIHSDAAALSRDASATTSDVRSPLLRFSDLTPNEQSLLRRFQAIRWGAIEGLVFENGEHLACPAPRAEKTIRLHGKGFEPVDVPVGDFALCEEYLRFFLFLRKQRCGYIRRIEIREGLPAEMRLLDVA